MLSFKLFITIYSLSQKKLLYNESFVIHKIIYSTIFVLSSISEHLQSKWYQFRTIMSLHISFSSIIKISIWASFAELSPFFDVKSSCREGVAMVTSLQTFLKWNLLCDNKK